MKVWSFFKKETGLFTGQVFSSSEKKALALNTPAGCAAVEGHYDPLSKRVDLTSGEIIDWQPPQPDQDHEWIDGRWTIKASVLAKRETVRNIEALECQQIRAMRELLLDTGNETARERLSALDAQIADLRSQIRGNAGG